MRAGNTNIFIHGKGATRQAARVDGEAISLMDVTIYFRDFCDVSIAGAKYHQEK